MSQPLAPCSQTAIANAITPARPKRREIPRQTKLSLLSCLTSGQLLPLKQRQMLSPILDWAFPSSVPPVLAALPADPAARAAPHLPGTKQGHGASSPWEGPQVSCVVQPCCSGTGITARVSLWLRSH